MTDVRCLYSTVDGTRHGWTRRSIEKRMNQLQVFLSFLIIASALLFPSVSKLRKSPEPHYKSRVVHLVVEEEGSSRSFDGGETKILASSRSEALGGNNIRKKRSSSSIVGQQKPPSSWKTSSEEDKENKRRLICGSPNKPKNECQIMGEWQVGNYLNCNKFHELDFQEKFTNTQQKSQRIGKGFWRQVWRVEIDDDGGVNNNSNNITFKTMPWHRNFTSEEMELNRIDSAVYNELTGSTNIIKQYGFCGTSGMFQFANGGDLSQLHKQRQQQQQPYTPDELLLIAYQLAAALEDFHNFDSNNRPTMAHTDIKEDQFLRVDGRYYLNDFNRVQMLTWNEEKQRVNRFTDKEGPKGSHRSPEEYNYKELDEKIDVWSMGNVFNFLVSQEYRPLSDTHSKTDDIIAAVSKGRHPTISKSKYDVTNYFHQIINKVTTTMCFIEDPRERASSRDIAAFFRSKVLERGLIIPTN